MRKHLEPIFKGVCVLLAGLLAVQVISLLSGGEKIGDLRVPDVQFAGPKTTAGPAAEASQNTGGRPPGMPEGLPEGTTLPAGASLPPGVELPPGVQLPPGVSISMVGGAMPVVSRGSSMAPGAAGGNPALAPDVQARVDAILSAELFGAVPKPPPMALSGIAGDQAIVRGTNGQEKLISVGEEVGGVKLLKIGTNRVLVEHEGQQKELTLFGGYGSEPLLNK